MERGRFLKVDIIRQAVADGVHQAEMPDVTGLSTTDVNENLSYLRRRKEIPRQIKRFSRQLLQQHRKHISEGMIGKKRPEVAIEQSKSWIVLRPLVLRNGTCPEIADITSFTERQVKRLVYFPRTVLGVDTYTAPENARERRRRAHTRAEKAKKGESLSGFEQESALFMKRYLETKKISDETHVWEKVKSLFYRENRNITDTFSYALMLEVFWHAREQALINNWAPFHEYVQIGRESNRDWFTSEKLNEDRRKISEAVGFRYVKTDSRRPFNQSFVNHGNRRPLRIK